MASIDHLPSSNQCLFQIWFQNRRQNDRRRQKPLEPHELVAHLRNNTNSPAPPQMSSSPNPEETSASQLHPNAPLSTSDPINRPSSRASSIHDLLNPTPSSPEETSAKHSTQETADSTASLTVMPGVETPATPTEGSENGDKLSDASSEVGSAKKRNHDEMTGKGNRIQGSEALETTETSASKKPLARTSSFVRLAMTVDGAVKVRTDNEPTPSPEKPRAAPPHIQNKTKTPMMRSKSAMNGVEVFRDSTQGGPKTMGVGFGRSRDARTWEFYCDSTSKDALSTQAEAETAGSAVSAINLIRSNSFKSRSQALSPSMLKTNVRSMALKEGRPKLSRTQSSLGRLQGQKFPAETVKEKSKAHCGHVRSPSGDSDKENWAPGTRMSEHALRRTEPSGRHRPILQENEEMTYPDVTSSQKKRAEASDSRQSPIKEMDCVQGLLSLSQGAWTMN